MATDFYFRSDAEDVTAETVEVLFGLTRGSSAAADTADSDNSNATGPSGASATEHINQSGTPFKWYSKPLAAVTISGTITFNLRGLESNMSANNQLGIRIQRTTGDGTVLSTIVESFPGVELGLTEAAQNWTASPTSTTLSNGDRLKVTICAMEGALAGATGHAITFWYNGPTAAASGDSWVRFNETITEFVAAFAPPFRPRRRCTHCR